MFSMSLHELTACIYYKIAIERGLRGCNPDGELFAHQLHVPNKNKTSLHASRACTETTSKNDTKTNGTSHFSDTSTDEDVENDDYECKDVRDADLNEAIRSV